MMGVTTTSAAAAGLKPRRSLKIDKPRALKLAGTGSSGEMNMESILAEMDLVTQCLQSGVWDHRVLYPAIASLCDNLKIFGPQLENVYKDQLDKCFIYLRTGCRDDRLKLAARYRLLEIIELRAMSWKPNQNLISYYQTKLQEIEAEEAAMEEQTELAAYMTTGQSVGAPLPHTMAATIATTPLQTPTTPTAMYHPHHHPQLQYGAPYPAPQPTILSPQTLLYAGQQYQGVIPLEQYQQTVQTAAQQVLAAPPMPQAPMLSPGEVVRTSGKFSKPTRIAGKNYCKDEVVIRNQDSGKVMGIKGRRVHMIEELSETIISFQRVAPGARERLVQITGPTEENINQAKQLIEDTIRRNASPVREAHSISSGGSSVFSSSPLNGSNSSIASHTDDDNSSLNGCKRNTLVHSLSMSAGDGSVTGGSSCGGDSCMGDYRYTVSHNNTAIRITGNNLSMVRTAKLVLDEYFNGEKDLNNIAQLLAGESNDQTPPPPPPLLPSPSTPTTPLPSTPPTLLILPRPSPTSTHSSSPPLMVKPATPPATPPPSTDRDADSPTTNGGAPRGDESPKNGGVGIIRQPLFPSSSKEAIEVAEASKGAGCVAAKGRRAAFAKTSEERSANGGFAYTKTDMFNIAKLPASKLTPSTWHALIQAVPELIKKGSVYEAILVKRLKEEGEGAINSQPSYLEASELLPLASHVTWNPKWTSNRTSSLHDDESRSSPSY